MKSRLFAKPYAWLGVVSAWRKEHFFPLCINVTSLWASEVVQTVKNLPAKREILV